METAASDGHEIESESRSAYYGLTEIAAALDLDRQLVTAWRRRGSHAIPEPDAELSSGPIWRGNTIEPWIEAMRARRSSSAEVADLRPETALRLCRRLLRCAALSLEQPMRTQLLARAVADARELLPAVTAASGPLAELAQAVAVPLGRHLEGKGGPGLRAALLEVLPAVSELSRAALQRPAGAAGKAG